MTREGAVEVNAATGKKKRISNRIRDADLTRKEAAPQQPEQAAQPLPGGTAPAPTADAPTLPHAPGAEREQDTAAAERVMEHIDGAHTRKTSKKAARKAQAEAEARTRTSRLQFTEEERATPELEKYIRKSDKAADRLDAAKAAIPKEKKLVGERTFDEATGKGKTRLRFEEREKPIGKNKPHNNPLSRPAQEAGIFVHNKIHSVEKDNSGVEGAHKSEELAERGAKYGARKVKEGYRSHKLKPYRAAAKAEKAAFKANVDTELYKQPFHKENLSISTKKVYKSSDTEKYVYELKDNRYIETVFIKRRDGGTVCVSTQVGCSVGCIFCESGRNGFVRNLTPSEIVQQVVLIRQKVNRIVFMGMGEPLFNYDNLIAAIHILRDRNGLNFPTDGITVSTVGPVNQLKKLREEHLKIQLTISLHAATQAARNCIIPHMHMYAIEDVVKQALSYSQRHNRKVVFAYLLLPGINDRSSDIRQLAKWFKGKNVMINVLQYNPTSNSKIRAPQKQEMVAFKHQLEQTGLEVTMRVSHGREIKAACGQLANTYNKAKKQQK